MQERLTQGVSVARAARYRAWRSASVMAVSPIGLRGMVSTPKRYVTIAGLAKTLQLRFLKRQLSLPVSMMSQ
jgi:hypothetical protein